MERNQCCHPGNGRQVSRRLRAVAEQPPGIYLCLGLSLAPAFDAPDFLGFDGDDGVQTVPLKTSCRLKTEKMCAGRRVRRRLRPPPGDGLRARPLVCSPFTRCGVCTSGPVLPGLQPFFSSQQSRLLETSAAQLPEPSNHNRQPRGSAVVVCCISGLAQHPLG